MAKLLFGLVLAGALALPAAAQATLTAEDAGRKLAEAYGVEVLKTRPVTLEDGGPGFAVTAMHPRSAGSGAFQVGTVVVDARTGALVPQFQHRSNGYQLPGASTFVPRTGFQPRAAQGNVWR